MRSLIASRSLRRLRVVANKFAIELVGLVSVVEPEPEEVIAEDAGRPTRAAAASVMSESEEEDEEDMDDEVE